MLWLFYQHLRPKKRLSILYGWNANKELSLNCSGCESGPVLRELLQYLQWADLESCLEITWKQFRVLVSSVRKRERESAIELSRLLNQAFWKGAMGRARQKGLSLKEGAEVLLFLQQGQRCSFCQSCWINAGFFVYRRTAITKVILSIANKP